MKNTVVSVIVVIVSYGAITYFSDRHIDQRFRENDAERKRMMEYRVKSDHYQDECFKRLGVKMPIPEPTP